MREPRPAANRRRPAGGRSAVACGGREQAQVAGAGDGLGPAVGAEFGVQVAHVRRWPRACLPGQREHRQWRPGSSTSLLRQTCAWQQSRSGRLQDRVGGSRLPGPGQSPRQAWRELSVTHEPPAGPCGNRSEDNPVAQPRRRMHPVRSRSRRASPWATLSPARQPFRTHTNNQIGWLPALPILAMQPIGGGDHLTVPPAGRAFPDAPRGRRWAAAAFTVTTLYQKQRVC